MEVKLGFVKKFMDEGMSRELAEFCVANADKVIKDVQLLNKLTKLANHPKINMTLDELWDQT